MRRVRTILGALVCVLGASLAIPVHAVAEDVGCNGYSSVGGQIITVAGNRVEVPTSYYQVCIRDPLMTDEEGNWVVPSVHPRYVSDWCGNSICHYLDVNHYGLPANLTVTIGYSILGVGNSQTFVVPLVSPGFDSICVYATGSDATSQDCLVGIED